MTPVNEQMAVTYNTVPIKHIFNILNQNPPSIYTNFQ